MAAPQASGATRRHRRSRASEAVLEQVGELHETAVRIRHAGREREAMRLFRRGLALLETISADADSRWLALHVELWIRLAYSEAEFGTISDGLARLDAVRPRLAELPEGPVRTELRGFMDHIHGTMLSRSGFDEDSLPLMESAIAHRRRLVAEATDDRERLTEALVASASNRGLTFVALGRLAEAKQDLDYASELAAEYDFPQKRAYLQHMLGDLEKRLGRLPQALHHYDEAERAYLELGPDMLYRLRIDQAQALLGAGLAVEAGRHLDEVLPQMRRQRIGQDIGEAELYRAAAALLEGDLPTAQQLAGSAQRRMRRRGTEGWATVAELLGLRVRTMRALNTGRVPAALVSTAGRLAGRLSELRLGEDAALARTLAAQLEVRRGRVSEAGDLLRRVPRPKPHTPLEHRMLLRLCKAELAAAQGNRRKAFAQARAGLTELGQARDRMGGLEMVSGTALHGQELGDLAMRLVLEGGESAAEARQLFNWLERTRAQMYRYEQVSGLENTQLVESIAEIRHVGHALREAKLDGRPVTGLQARYNELQHAATRLGWHAATRWGRPRPVATVEEVAAQLGARVLISFAASGDKLLAVVVADGRVRIVRLGSARRAAERTRRLHADLNAMAPDHLAEPLLQAISASARKEADLLDEQLMRPLLEFLGDREVVLVPTGTLYAVPWNVLGSMRYRPIVVAPSATAWLAASRPETETSGTVLVRGPNLLAATGEIDKLAAHHRHATQFAADRADVRTVLDALDGVDLAHIAAHGSHEPDNALFSRLELADGALFAHEVAALRRPPRQVVLAACELALNLIRPGDEALGFAGALLASGTHTVVAAASRVGDHPAAAAMDDYHRALSANVAPATALADAVGVDPLRRPFICLGSGHTP
ncbi:CHAT domain-containing protein [Amycolatopsis magusensis]|uniref:CHAT domain-containing protein/tetratricopeptide (TPR) repeat protein n=1 Tax=Amycolatopsis magusensis TaxID=882444 RepID=A0ABS4PNY5_9PSEU|nr:CHAT domain-containing protein [Amycolatopsis magusensis]MBP2180549.1 CHAT domain-containing protein/tetratricopeptide (TPR) repeat protein [Amycolatopsis magusensis]